MQLAFVLLLTVAAEVVESFSFNWCFRRPLLFQLGARESPCEQESDAENVDFTRQPGSAKMLRQAVLTDSHGDKVTLGDKMGERTSVVVFLRHLG